MTRTLLSLSGLLSAGLLSAAPALAQDDSDELDPIELTEDDTSDEQDPDEQDLDEEDLEAEEALEDFTPVDDGVEDPGPPPATFSMSVGALVGAALFPQAPLEPSGLARLEIGARLPIAGGRLRPALSIGRTAPRYQGSGEHETLAEPYTYTLTAQQLDLRLGVVLSALPHHVPVNPELFIGPQLFWLHTVVETSSGGASIGEVHERATRVGWVATPGIAVNVGRGQLLFQAGLSGSSLDGVLAGDVGPLRVSPALGYRFHATPAR